MDTITRLTCKLTKDKKTERYCNVYESLKESFKEVKLIKQGKIKTKPWRQLLKEIKDENKE